MQSVHWRRVWRASSACSPESNLHASARAHPRSSRDRAAACTAGGAIEARCRHLCARHRTHHAGQLRRVPSLWRRWAIRARLVRVGDAPRKHDPHRHAGGNDAAMVCGAIARRPRAWSIAGGTEPMVERSLAERRGEGEDRGMDRGRQARGEPRGSAARARLSRRQVDDREARRRLPATRTGQDQGGGHDALPEHPRAHEHRGRPLGKGRADRADRSVGRAPCARVRAR